MTSLNEWIDMKIKDDDINYFEYDEFSNVEKVDEGEIGIVNRADWKIGRIKIVLKILANNFSINEDNMNEFLKELKNLRKVGFHPNINKFFGITKDPLSNNYIMVLKYANQGNLRDYLKNNFSSLQWNDKIRMALDITCGLKFLHSRAIIHRDLHAKNTLVHNNKLMIADFGLSKQLTVSSNSTVYNMPAYVEPQYYKNDNYMRDKKSDIHSLGILLWEITSGYPPFSTIPVRTLSYKIANGLKEQPIINTPLKYQQLYQKCWNDEPNLRPNINDVVDILEGISLKPDTNNNKDNSKFEVTVGLDINNETNSNLINQQSINTDLPSELRLPSLPQINNQISSSASSSLSENERELNNILDEVIQAYLQCIIIGWNALLIMMYDVEYKKFFEVLAKHESKLQEIFNYLINNPAIEHYEVIVGKFYEEGFGINKNENKAFEWYMKGSQKNNVNGHYEVGSCYHYGTGIEKNYKKAFEFYQLAANNGLNVALYRLAYCYSNGYGIQRDYIKAFELYKKTAENGFAPSYYMLADCYENGIGTQKNKLKSLKWSNKW